MKNRYSLISLLKYHNYKNSVIHYDSKITEKKNRNKGSGKNHKTNNNNSSNNINSINSSRDAKR